MKFSPQDASAWARVSPYLDEALDLERHERAGWLENLAKTQPEVARAVEELLSELVALDARGFLTSPPLPVADLASFMPALEHSLRANVGVESGDWLPEDRVRSLAIEQALTPLSARSVVGAYRLLREIGHGGMSSVWRAERCDGLLKREVALKLPYEGPRRAQMAERFKRECEILETLTHPNIARLYDAGVSPTGQSYLAMEYVQGTTLIQYCDARRLSVRERLEVFLQVLSAVEFAHSQLVLHRDLKPSNILVTEQGRVVLLDFGIAKLLAPELNSELPLTEMASRMLTPDYASPEHIAGYALSTTSDVYSLGVVLYELLSGVRPFALKDASRHALEEAVLNQDPVRPSQSVLPAAAAEARHSTPRRLAHTLRGDLDTIILKALKKTPAQRYHSVGAFAQDISNYLQNLPVSARPDSRRYQTRRFIARHKLPVGAAAVTLLALISGGAMAVWQARVAESQARVAEAQARVAAHERDKAVALASRNGAMNDFIAQLISEAARSDRPVTVSELLARSEKLAIEESSESSEDHAAILGMTANLMYTALGDESRAAQLFDRALALVAESRDSNLRARLVCQHAFFTAHADARKLDAATRAVNDELGTPELDPAIASTCLLVLARLTEYTQDMSGALKYATQALARFHQASRQPLTEHAIILGELGEANSLNGQNQQADRYYQQALQKYAQAGRERSLVANILINNWALVSARAGVPKRALELEARALRSLEQNDAGAPPPAELGCNRAAFLVLIGRYAEAKANYERALRLMHESKLVTFKAYCLLDLAGLAEVSGDRLAARRYLSEGSRLAAPADRRALMIRLALEGRIDLNDGKLAQARAKFGQVVAMKERTPATIRAALGWADVELLSGDAAAAVARSQEALNMATSMQGGVPYSVHTGHASLMLGRALQARGDIPQARKAFETAITHLSNTVDADHPELLRARRLLASLREK